MNGHKPIRFGAIKTRWVCILPLLAALTTCDNLNQSIKAGLIAPTTSFPAGSGAIAAAFDPVPYVFL
jgi:hypothetical protein